MLSTVLYLSYQKHQFISPLVLEKSLSLPFISDTGCKMPALLAHFQTLFASLTSCLHSFNTSFLSVPPHNLLPSGTASQYLSASSTFYLFSDLICKHFFISLPAPLNFFYSLLSVICLYLSLIYSIGNIFLPLFFCNLYNAISMVLYYLNL